MRIKPRISLKPPGYRAAPRPPVVRVLCKFCDTYPRVSEPRCNTRIESWRCKWNTGPGNHQLTGAELHALSERVAILQGVPSGDLTSQSPPLQKTQKE